jgi:hypothetical protein
MLVWLLVSWSVASLRMVGYLSAVIIDLLRNQVDRYLV